jgi:hypothetical protein
MRIKRKSLRLYPLWIVEFRAGTEIYNGWRWYCVQARSPIEALDLARAELLNDGFSEYVKHRISKC